MEYCAGPLMNRGFGFWLNLFRILWDIYDVPYTNFSIKVIEVLISSQESYVSHFLMRGLQCTYIV